MPASPRPFTLPPGQRCELDEIPSRVEDPDWTKESAETRIADNAAVMGNLSEKLFAENRRSVLVLLQGMDAGGKDSTIRSITSGMNPRSLMVHSFGVPSAEELDHDFLWRVHHRVPRKGNITIFNRSHYEDVLVVRVHNLAPGTDWDRRFAQINDFERLLAENGTTLIKCYLHISKDEQRRRLQDRIDDPADHWKVNLRDHEERKYWSQYRRAFNDAISNCNTPHAPWHIVPADVKWYRKLLVSELMLDALVQLDPQYPPPQSDLSGIVVE